MWWGNCDDCDFRIVIDGDGQDVPGPADWDQFPMCLVCGSSVSFDSSGETMWQRENRLMDFAAKSAIARGGAR